MSSLVNASIAALAFTHHLHEVKSTVPNLVDEHMQAVRSGGKNDLDYRETAPS